MTTFKAAQEKAGHELDIAALSVALQAREIKIATVESCTGGSVAALFTGYAGSSLWFDRGFVTYSNLSKIEMVGVNAEILRREGAVSESVAAEMAEGGVRQSEAECALSITGVAGPGGGSEHKPVGMVCFAWAGFSPRTLTETRYFQGDRRAVREQSVIFSVQGVLKLLDISSMDRGLRTN